MNKVDKILFDVYGSYPCLSPGRYQSFDILTNYFEKNSFNNKKIIELGCGTGVYALFLDRLLKNGFYTGIDLELKQNPNLIKKSVKNIKTDFRVMDAADLKFKKNSYDLVMSFWSLEHIKNDAEVLKQAYNILKKKGIFIIAAPSAFTFAFHLGRHGFRCYSKKDIKNKLNEAGFKIKKTHSVGGLFGFAFSLCLNWFDNLVLAPFYVYYKIFNPKKLKGDSRQDIGGGLAKKIVSKTTHVYRKTLIGRKIHFRLLKIIKVFDSLMPIFPTAYLIVAKKNKV